MKSLLLIGALIFSSWANAHEACGEPHFHEFDEILALKKEIQWFAASSAELKTSHCLKKEPFSIDEMTEWMFENHSHVILDRNINGIQFKEESPENLEAFYHLTTYMRGGVPDLRKTKQLSSNCTKVACAMKELFGAQSTQLLFMQRRFGMNGSHLVQESAAPWKSDELDVVLLALNDYPEGILPFQKSRTLIHAPRDLNNGRVLANATVTVFKAWDEMASTDKRVTIFHEIAHALGGVTGVDKSETWYGKGGWAGPSRLANGELVPIAPTAKPGTMVSRYGKTNEREDFAESIVAYRYNPSHLKEKSPEKYELLKQIIFDNVEYTSKEKCDFPDRTTAQINLKMKQEVESWEPSPQEITTITNRCGLLAFKQINEKGLTELGGVEMEKCYKDEIEEMLSNKAYESTKGTPHHAYLKPVFRNFRPEMSREKLLNLLSKSRKVHKHTLENAFINAFKDPYFCHPAHKNNVDSRFSEKDLGFNPSRNRDLFLKLPDQACDMLKRFSPEWLAERFVE